MSPLATITILLATITIPPDTSLSRYRYHEKPTKKTPARPKTSRGFFDDSQSLRLGEQVGVVL